MRAVVHHAKADLPGPAAARAAVALLASCLAVVAAVVEVGIVVAALAVLAGKLLWWLAIGTAGGVLVFAALAESAIR